MDGAVQFSHAFEAYSFLTFPERSTTAVLSKILAISDQLGVDKPAGLRLFSNRHCTRTHLNQKRPFV